MNFEKIYEGQEIKNYKELCALLGINPTNAKVQRTSQMERFGQKVDYTKQGHKIFVNKVHDVEVVTKTGGAEAFKRKELCYMLVSSLKKNNNHLIATKPLLCHTIGLPFLKNDIKNIVNRQLRKKLHNDYFSMEEVSGVINRFSLGKLNGTVDFLSKTGVIEYKNIIQISFEGGKQQIVNEEEYSYIKSIEKEILDDYEEKNLYVFRFKYGFEKYISEFKYRTEGKYIGIFDYFHKLDITLKETKNKFDIDTLNELEVMQDIRVSAFDRIESNIETHIYKAREEVKQMNPKGFGHEKKKVSNRKRNIAETSYDEDFKTILDYFKQLK